ncbi:hypothetical protein ACU61A_39195 [Pseudonocardia sichuanensis]
MAQEQVQVQAVSHRVLVEPPCPVEVPVHHRDRRHHRDHAGELHHAVRDNGVPDLVELVPTLVAPEHPSDRGLEPRAHGNDEVLELHAQQGRALRVLDRGPWFAIVARLLGQVLAASKARWQRWMFITIWHWPGCTRPSRRPRIDIRPPVQSRRRWARMHR